MIRLTNFSLLPILAKSFWNVAKHSGDFPNKKDFFNKRLSLVTKDISIYCIFSKRYYFFSNNDAYIKLDYEIVNECHKYVYYNFEDFNAPLLYKLLSAQFILAHFLNTEYDRTELQTFLLNTRIVFLNHVAFVT